MYNVYHRPSRNVPSTIHRHARKSNQMPIPIQPDIGFNMCTETPLRSYGFQWDPFQAFAVKRRCKRKGGKLRPPLGDDLDVERDPYTAKPIWWGGRRRGHQSHALESVCPLRRASY